MATLINRSRRQRAKTGGVAIWTALVAVVFLWQFVQYRGIVALLAEWQFNFLGRSYPAISYLLPVAVLALPALLIFWRTRPRHSAQRIALATQRSAIAFQKTMWAVAAAFALAAVVFLFQSLDGAAQQVGPQRIDLGSPVTALPPEGPATISGSVLTTRTAALRQNFLLLGKSYRFAPIVPPGSKTTDLQYFGELSPSFDQAAIAPGSTLSGTLKRDALPGEIIRLYRYAGYNIADPHYVLFLDPASARWPDLQTAIQLGLIGLVFAVLALLQRRRLKRIQEALNSTPALAEQSPKPPLT
jgi:hypothetical protein